MPEPVCRDERPTSDRPLVTISLESHYELYHDWRKALTFCRDLPNVSPPQPVTFHMYWRQWRAGCWWKARPFGRKQALPVKAFFATQDLSRCSLVLWSDDDLSRNEWLQPFAGHLTFRTYRPEVEVRDTPLEQLPRLYRQRDRRVWRDGDLFRMLVLHNYGGVYVDMDIVLLRSLGVFLDREFIYQWEHFDHEYNGALMHLWKGSEFARELILGVMEIPPRESSWGRANFARAIGRGRSITVLPSPFFDTDWQAEPRSQPFKRMPHSSNLYDGAFAWHWHNRWDEPIEHGSRFQLFETRIDEKVAEMGFAAGPFAHLAKT